MREVYALAYNDPYEQMVETAMGEFYKLLKLSVSKNQFDGWNAENANKPTHTHLSR